MTLSSNPEALLLSVQDEHDLQDVAARITRAHRLPEPVALVIEVLDPYHDNIVTVSVTERNDPQELARFLDFMGETNFEDLGDVELFKNKIGLEEIFRYWTTKMEVLHKEAEQAIVEYDETAQAINAEVEQRQVWLKAHGYTTLK